MDWHYSDGVNQFGPVSEEQFDQLVAAGRITPQTLVWRDGMPQWETYGKIASARIAAPAAPAAPAKSSAPEPYPDPKTMFGMPPPEGLDAFGGQNPDLGYADTASCVSCGRPFPISEMLRYESSFVCPTCKPIFFQRLREGLQAKHTHLEYGGFWIRFLAKIIDNIISAILMIGILVAYGAAAGETLEEQIAASVRINLLSIVITAGYATFFVGKFGGTPGKLICGLRVVTPDGYPVGYGRAFGRFAAEMVTSFTLGIGYIIAAFDSEKRTLHDRLAGTRVIKV